MRLAGYVVVVWCCFYNLLSTFYLNRIIDVLYKQTLLLPYREHSTQNTTRQQNR
jgi:hypothetical protein